MNSYCDKIAIVTGAGSGVGKALCERLSDEGAHVFALDVRQDLLHQLSHEHSGLSTIVVDVSDRNSLRAALQGIRETCGRVDFVFNNAGILMGGETQYMSDAQWDRMLAVNLHGVVYGSQVAYEMMVEQGFGHIINTSSTAGIIPVCQSAAYTCTKFGVLGLSLSLAAEAKRHGVKVSALILGPINTEIFGTAVNMNGYNYDKKMQNPLIHKLRSEKAAAVILRAVAKGRQVILVPQTLMFLIALYRLAPRLCLWLMEKVM